MSIKRIKKIIKIEKESYIVLHIIPDTSVRDYNTENIAKTISTLYRDSFEYILRGKRNNALRGLYFRDSIKLNFLIKIKKGIDNTNFYLTVPEQFKNMMKEKCSSAWPKATIYEMPKLPISNMPLNYELVYKKEDALSLKCDKRSNEPLKSIINILDTMEGDDEINVLYNFIPHEQLGWRNKYRDTMAKIKVGKTVDRNKLDVQLALETGVIYTMEQIIEPAVGEFIKMVTGDESNLMKSDKKVKFSKAGMDFIRDMSSSSVNKVDACIVATQILVSSKSVNLKRMRNNALAVCESFKVLNEDNSLTYRVISPSSFNYTKGINNLAKNKMSTSEIANLIQLPGREILNKYDSIRQVDITQTDIPKLLTQGELCLGTNQYKNKESLVYMTMHKDFKRLAICIVGPSRCGKTTLISNLCKNALDAGQCNIILDFVETCKLSDTVEEVSPKGKVLRIDCMKNIQGFGYNEIVVDNNFPWQAYVNAKLKTTQVVSFMNSVNASDKDLKTKMERYFEAAALLVFIQNGSLNDVFGVLRNHETRKKFVTNAPKPQLKRLEEYIESLRELDEINDKTKEIKGTRLHLVTGIFDRLHTLKKNPYMELMLTESSENNVNLSIEIEKNQTIFIRMPEGMLPTEEERDILTTYWITKIWLALQVRADRIKDVYKRGIVNIFVDEMGQVPHAQEYMTPKLSQCAKFGGKFILSCMYLSQIPIIRGALVGANTSYMLIAGCDKSNYNELKEELKPYELNDLLKLPERHSLNLIKYTNGYARFITRLPKPLKEGD